MQLTSTSAVIKEIEYDRETKDYAAFVTIDERREYIGSRRSYDEADRLCDEYAYHHFADNHTPEVAAQIAVAMEGACPTCGDEGDCPDCYQRMVEQDKQLGLDHATPSAFCHNCGGEHSTKHCPETEPLPPFCFFHPDASDHNTRDCPKVEEEGFGEPPYSVFN